MLGSYAPILVMLVLSAIIAMGMTFASFLLGPKRPTRFKQAPYECGMTPVGSARERFPVKFYLIAMLFIIFDIETIFLYPWAVTFRSGDRAMKVFSLVEMAVFVTILFVGYFYILGRRALEWDEGQDEHPAEGGIDGQRAYQPRPAIRFDNENSGPVRLPAVPPGGAGAMSSAGAPRKVESTR
ncbi:MAG: NADH-quinone oxidoreductase subunit A [Chthonomonadales bacterium]|nr:NADH-quinone oxidoreductase subunit A [Chthonomonadales bacterium]